MRNITQRFGMGIVWATWLYPFLRIVLILPMMLIEDHISEATAQTLLTGIKYVHGGKVVDMFLITVYPVYFILSLIGFFFWHYKTKMRIGWGQRISLVLVILLNGLMLAGAVFLSADLQENAGNQRVEAPRKLQPADEVPESSAKSLYLGQ